MIVESQQFKGSNSVGPARIISRLKLHPSLLQQKKDDIQLNFIGRKSQPKITLKRYLSKQTQDDSIRRSKVFLRPLVSRSVSRKLTHKTELSEQKSNRSDRKLLFIMDSPSRKDNSLKDLLTYNKGKDEMIKMKRILDAFSQNTPSKQVDLDIEEQFYEQVRIAQQFKELNRRTK